MSEPWARIVRLEAVHNFRDFGGWRTADGGRVATGRLFRSAHHARATARDLDRIAALPIATVVDLRRPREQREQPSAWIGRLPLDLVAPGGLDDDGGEAPHLLAFRKSDFSYDAMRAFLTTHYGEMPYDPRHVALFRDYFDVLAARDGAVLIHCAAGKDRTGILAFLTHHLLGVHPDDAMEDYLLSNDAGNIAEQLPPLQRSMERSYGRPVAAEALHALLSVYPDYIGRCQAAIRERSGSIDAYLADALDVDAGKRARIRAALLR